MSEELRTLSALELKKAFERRELSPVEVAADLLDHVQHHDHALNAWCLIDRETTLEIAEASEQRYLKGEAQGLLDGIPVAVKDVFLTPMWPTLKGSRTIDGASTLNKRSPAMCADNITLG